MATSKNGVSEGGRRKPFLNDLSDAPRKVGKAFLFLVQDNINLSVESEICSKLLLSCWKVFISLNSNVVDSVWSSLFKFRVRECHLD